MNAKVGKEIAAFTGTIGTHSLHENSNDNGIRLATLATEYNLVVGGTLFPHKEKHKGTWLSPDGNITNQIDHMLVKRKFRSALMDVRAYWGVDCDSDHYMVAAKIRIRLVIKRKNGGQTAKIDTEKLKEEETRLQYQVEVENRLQH
ncbi:craniofacial development protein 2-like [Macrobrachium nipponense]|uniref:craniofacial development protein 2-like n=1 Tax=Macrobrachium nipponense TaxID=159736 RepID=UPI0030C7CB5A